MRILLKRLALGAAGLTTAALLAIVLIISYVQFSHLDAITTSLDALEPASYAIILGASVKNDGTPSDALYDRILIGSELMKAKKVSALLMTGDGGAFHINEVAAMKRVAMELGVAEQDIIVDGQGYRTYESCKRARQVYDIREAIVVTQRFHLARSVYLCEFFGIRSQGMVADRQTYQKESFFILRDLASSFKAWWDTRVLAPEPPV